MGLGIGLEVGEGGGISQGVGSYDSDAKKSRETSPIEKETFGILDWLRCCESRRNEIRKGSWPENGRKRTSAAKEPNMQVHTRQMLHTPQIDTHYDNYMLCIASS